MIICTNQDLKTSQAMALQYVVATFAGALLAGALAMLVQQSSIILLIIVAVTFLAFTVKELNNTFQVFFFTILILLVISIAGTGQSFAIWRIIAILIGVGIVLAILALNQALLRISHR